MAGEYAKRHVTDKGRFVMEPQQEAHWQPEEATEQPHRAAPEPLPPPYVTYILLTVITAVYVAMVWFGHSGIWATSPEMRSLFGDKDNALIMAGQWWRFVTPIFLHGGLLHFAVNSYSLYRLGSQMELFYGSRRYLILFVVAGIAGNIASFLFSPGAHSVGASGALFGLIGAGLVFPWRYRALIPAPERRRIFQQIAQVAIINLLIGLSLKGIIDNAAHIGGMVGGGLAALFLLPDALMSRPLRPLANSALWIGAMLATGLLIVSGLLQSKQAPHFAVSKTLAMQASYPPDANVPWWSVRVPLDWKQVGSASPYAGAWNGPQGMTLEITDSLHDPLVSSLAKQLSEQAASQARIVRIDAKPARVFTLGGPDRIADLYFVETYGRIMAIKMETTATGYAQAQPVFQAILSSFRFIHPPTPEEDAAQPVAVAP